MPIEMLEELPGCRIGAFDSLLVSVWYGELTIPMLDRLSFHHQALVAKHGKITFLSVVVNATGSPPAHVREHMKTKMPDMVPMRRGNYVVVLARGMAGVIARTFLAALSLINSENMKVFASVAEAVAAVQAIGDQSVTIRASTALVTDLQAFVGLPAPVVTRADVG
ncbi:MAG: hypothetical protein JNG84_09740 [Archangium sp.]|nr:hypothetical protein [Archangium sp.]